jgi:hypothetical protein
LNRAKKTIGHAEKIENKFSLINEELELSN